MTVYKVVRYAVRYCATGFYSAVVTGLGMRLQYRIGEQTMSRKDSMGIFVFDSLKNARRFRAKCDMAILECKSSLPVTRRRKCLLPAYTPTYRKLKGAPSWVKLIAPKGTLTAEWIIPTRLVS